MTVNCASQIAEPIENQTKMLGLRQRIGAYLRHSSQEDNTGLRLDIVALLVDKAEFLDIEVAADRPLC